MYMYKLFDFVITFISETKIYVVNLELYPFNFVVTFILETKKKMFVNLELCHLILF